MAYYGYLEDFLRHRRYGEVLIKYTEITRALEGWSWPKPSDPISTILHELVHASEGPNCELIR